MSGEPAARYLGMKPDEMAAAFTAWAAGEGILARVTEEQCADLAKAFMAGCVYAARLTVTYATTGGGQGGTSTVVHHNHRLDEPCPAGCPGARG